MNIRKVFVLIATLLISCMMITGCSSGDSKESVPPEPPEVSNNTLEVWGFSFELPDYCKEPSYQDEMGYRYDVGDEAVIDLIATDVPNMDPDIYSFKAQRESTVERPVLNTEDITVAGMKGIMQTLDIYDDADERMWILADEENKRVFVFTVMQNEGTHTRDYIADFEKVFSSMKRIDEDPATVPVESNRDRSYYVGLWKPRLEDTESWNGGEGLSEEEKESFSKLYIQLNEDGSYSAYINPIEGEKEGRWQFVTDKSGEYINEYIELENYGMDERLFYYESTDTIVAGGHTDFYRSE